MTLLRIGFANPVDQAPNGIGRLAPTTVTNRCDATGTSLNSGSIISYRSGFRVLATCTNIQIEFANRRFLLSTGETAPTAEIIEKAALELADGTIIPVYFNGVREPTLVVGQRVRSDVIPVTLTAGDLIFVRCRPQPVIASSPMPIVGGANLGTLTGGGNAAGDQVDGASALFTGTAVAHTPTAIIGVPTQPLAFSGIIMGDSIAYGSGDVMMGDGDYGFLGRVLSGLGVPHFKNAAPGLAMPDFLGTTGADLSTRTTWTREYLTELRSSYAFICMGNNDVHNVGIDLAALQSRFTRWMDWFRGMGLQVVCTTISPRTTTSNAWATLAGQTKSTLAVNVKRRAFNDWLLTKPHPAIVEVWDLASYVSEPTDPDLWRVDGGANTNDGTHPNLLGHTRTATGILAGPQNWRPLT